MNVDIPNLSGDILQLTLDDGDKLFIVGPNGSGKSALIQHIVSANPDAKLLRVPAHRQTWFQSSGVDLTPSARRNLDDNIPHREMLLSSRFTDVYAKERLSIILFDLVAKENERARIIASRFDSQKPEEAQRIADKEPSPFTRINELLKCGNLSVTIELSRNDEILARHKDASNPFSIVRMSDGERNAVIMAATVLTVNPGTTLLIDEPERHLHRSIIEPFLSALFQSRNDCSFIISTHEIELPVANPEAPVFFVRSCSWNGNTATAWDIDRLEANSDLPEDLKRDILGSRKRILFVEGDELGSLDFPLYSALFPDLSIVPKGGCSNVLRAVSGLRGSQNLHHVEAFGLVDRDNRKDDEIEQLATQHVYALDVYSAEALYYCSDAIDAVAQHQAASLGDDATKMIRLARQNALTALKDDELAKTMAAKRCERQVRNQIISGIPSWKSIKANSGHPVAISIPSPYPDELAYFKDLVRKENLDELIARYPIRESRVFNAIASALQLTGRDTYQKTLLSIIQTDEKLAESIRMRVKALATELFI